MLLLLLLPQPPLVLCQHGVVRGCSPVLLLHRLCSDSAPSSPTPSPRLRAACSGEAAVTQGGKEVNRLFKADFFGEKALLSNEPRGATVVASQSTTCLVLDRDTFVEILGPLDKAMAVSPA